MRRSSTPPPSKISERPTGELAVRSEGVFVKSTALLATWPFFLFGISANQVFSPLGSIGQPALILGLIAAFYWFISLSTPWFVADHSQKPGRTALIVYGWFSLLSYAVASTRSLTDLEAAGSTRRLIYTLGLVGLAVVVSDCTRSIDRLTVLLRRTVWASLIMSTFGIFQFITGDFSQPLIPGLMWNFDAEAVRTRAVFFRPLGTTTHPIELSVVAASLLPLALHFSLYARKGGQRQISIASAIGLALCVPMSVSRSGILSLGVGMTIMFFGWSWRRRLRGALIGLVSIPALGLLVPGLIASLVDLFAWWDSDPSVQARVDRTPGIMRLYNERPWLGLGNGTWSVEEYFLIDNQVYVSLLETGLVGLTIMILLFVITFFSGFWVSHAPTATEESAHLGRALSAGIAAIGLSFFTFDAFHYRILTGVLFLFMGAATALLRLTQLPPYRLGEDLKSVSDSSPSLSGDPN